MSSNSLLLTVFFPPFSKKFQNLYITFCDVIDYSPPGSSVHGYSPGKNTGVGCHVLLQGIFLIQGSNLWFLHWQVGSLPLSHWGNFWLQSWPVLQWWHWGALSQISVLPCRIQRLPCGYIRSKSFDLSINTASLKAKWQWCTSVWHGAGKEFAWSSQGWWKYAKICQDTNVLLKTECTGLRQSLWRNPKNHWLGTISSR